MEHEMSVEHHDGHARASDEGAEDLMSADGLRLTVGYGKEGHGKEWASAYDERSVGGGGIEHRGILREEIQGAASDAQQQHDKLV